MRGRILFPIFLALAAVASAQISVEEAQRRLSQRLATRPSATPPISEVDRLRAENSRLREENAELTTEVTQLRDALAVAAGSAPTTRPTTQPAPAVSGPAATIVGHWKGGTLADGTAFLADFADDGTYKESWLTAQQHDEGHWAMISDDVLEMWTNLSGDDQPHKQWHIQIAKDQLTLQPLNRDGSENTRAHPMVLQRTP